MIIMMSTVSVTSFRNDIFNYVNFALAKQKHIGITKEKKIVGWFVPNVVKAKIKRDKVDIFLEEINKLQQKYPIMEGKNLSRDIDEILYGQK